MVLFFTCVQVHVLLSVTFHTVLHRWTPSLCLSTCNSCSYATCWAQPSGLLALLSTWHWLRVSLYLWQQQQLLCPTRALLFIHIVVPEHCRSYEMLTVLSTNSQRQHEKSRQCAHMFLASGDDIPPSRLDCHESCHLGGNSLLVSSWANVMRAPSSMFVKFCMVMLQLVCMGLRSWLACVLCDSF
jgi:hypothetical protein